MASLPPSNCYERCSNGTCVEGDCICERGCTLRRLESVDVCVPRCVNGSSDEEFDPLADNGYICTSREAAGLWQFFEQYYPFIMLVGLILLLVVLMSGYFLVFRNVSMQNNAKIYI